MYVDTQTELSDAQAITATAISTNVIDLFAALGGGTNIAGGNTTMDVGQGEDIYLVVSAAAAFGGTGTITVTLETAAAANLSSSTVLLSSPAITATAITAGYNVFAVKLPNASYQRYLGVRYTCSGTPSGGTFDAFLTKDVQRSLVYKSAFTVQ